ncbi:MAG TPA: 2-phospho-L-lactate guanylyltransferase [Candidatus Cybelea sp.]|nr:2-phospho-L-lactate guanylyltransferase [Candidatus Cybelea sp.]
MSLNILIPCKSLLSGKSRLAPVLDADRRRDLCTRFLTQTLATAMMIVDGQHCHVVTSDAAAAALAKEHGANVITDSDRGLNEALEAGRDGICSRHDGDAAILVLPIDLPWAGKTALRELLRNSADVVLAPDRRRAGTNALRLGLRAVGRFPFRFGEGSFAAHQRAAAEFSVAVVDDPRLAFDIDRPEDYAEWQAAVAGQSMPLVSGRRRRQDFG